MRHFLVFFFLICSLWALPKDPLLLQGGEKHIVLTPHVSYYLDPTSHLRLNDILSKELVFKSTSQEQISFSNQYDSTLWVTFTLQNTSTIPLDYLVEYTNPLVSYLNLYDERGTHLGSGGMMKEESFRKHMGHSLKLTVPAKSIRTYILKVKNTGSSMKLRLMLWENDSYTSAKIAHWNTLALFSGALAILVLYNFMLFIFTRDQAYFYYIITTTAMLIHEGFVSGYAGFFINIGDFATNKNFGTIIIFFTFIFVPMFTRSFMKLQTVMPKYDLYLKYLPAIFLPVTVITFYGIIPALFYRMFLIFSIFSIIFITYQALLKGVKQARYYVVGWTAILGAYISLALHRGGFISFDPENFYLTELALLFEALVFSAGLAARIRYIQEEKEASDQKLIHHQAQEKERLENEVSRRTNELSKALNMKNLLLKEVHHRVKNNMQIIISLLRLQSNKLNDKKLQDAVAVSEQRIKAMASVHEMLYTQEDISEIKAEQYFRLLSNEAHSAYDTFGNIVITIETELLLVMERAIYLGLIINELVINACKYAFDSQGGEINISLMLEQGREVLIVKDNGRGGELNPSESSLGMLLVNTLVTQQLGGSIVTTNDQGITHTMIFKESTLQ